MPGRSQALRAEVGSTISLCLTVYECLKPVITLETAKWPGLQHNHTERPAERHSTGIFWQFLSPDAKTDSRAPADDPQL